MPDVSLASLALRLAVSMGVVITLMVFAAKLLRRAQAVAAGTASGSRRSGGRVKRVPIAVTIIAPLTRGASVAIVRAAGREMVLGVTETHVTLLHSAIETRDAIDARDAIDTRHAIDTPDGIDTRRAVGAGEPLGGGHDLIELDPLTDVARIATPDALDPHTGDDGKPAWTDALETLRAMTVRR